MVFSVRKRLLRQKGLPESVQSQPILPLICVWIEKWALRKRPHVSTGRHQQPVCGDPVGTGGGLDPGLGGRKLRQQARTKKKEGSFAEANWYLKGLFGSTLCLFLFHFLFFLCRQGTLLAPSLFSCDTLPYHGLSCAHQTLVGKVSSGKRGAAFMPTLCKGHLSKGLPFEQEASWGSR